MLIKFFSIFVSEVILSSFIDPWGNNKKQAQGDWASPVATWIQEPEHLDGNSKFQEAHCAFMTRSLLWPSRAQNSITARRLIFAKTLWAFQHCLKYCYSKTKLKTSSTSDSTKSLRQYISSVHPRNHRFFLKSNRVKTVMVNNRSALLLQLCCRHWLNWDFLQGLGEIILQLDLTKSHGFQKSCY